MRVLTKQVFYSPFATIPGPYLTECKKDTSLLAVGADVSRIALRQKHGRKQGKNELYIVQNNMVHTCVHPLNSYAPRTFKSHMAGVMTLR